MNIQNVLELRRALEKAGVQAGWYSFESDGPGEIFRLEAATDAEGPIWNVYYAERGQRSGVSTFRSEAQACQQLFARIVKDRAVYLPRA